MVRGSLRSHLTTNGLRRIIMIFTSQYKVLLSAFLAIIIHSQVLGMAIPVVGELYSYLKNHKAPLNIVGVNGLMPHPYSIVYTTITIKSDDYTYASKKLGPSPLITRTVLGSVGATNPVSQFQAQLDVPDSPIDLLSSTHNIPQLVSTIAGTVNPAAGAVSGAVSAILDIGLQMASAQINKTLGIQETTVGLIEILPARYYRINSDTNEIELTPDFKQDLAAYDALHTQAIPVVQAFNNINKQYQFQRIAYYKKYGTYDLPDDEDAENDYNALIDLYNNQLVPALKTAVDMLKQLEQYNLHRISIMALNTKPGNSTIAGFKGPFRLNIFFFLGAKATNTFTMDFYVKDSGNVQNLIIKISPDILSTNPMQWNKGGIKLIGVDKHNQPSSQTSQLGFLTVQAGQQKIVPESSLCSWWDSMIISGDDSAKGLTQYLLPFDMYKLQKEVQDSSKTQNSAVLQAATTAMGNLTKFFGKKETQAILLDPTSSTTGAVQSSSTGCIFGLVSNISSLVGSQSSSTSSTNTTSPASGSSSVINPNDIPDL